MNISIKGDKLIIEVDVSKEALEKASASKSGKTRVVDSTGGFKVVNDKIKVGVNVITPN